MYMTNQGTYYPSAGFAQPRDYYSKDSHQEVYEQKSQRREQSILKAAQSLLKMSVHKSYDLNAPGAILPPKSMVDMFTEDPFKYSFDVKLQRRSSALDINSKNHLIRKKSKHEQDKQRMMNAPTISQSIVEKLDGRERMLNHLENVEAKSRSISRSIHIRASSYDIAKGVLQAQTGVKPIIGNDVDARQRERSRKMSDMANFLRYQIAQRLINLDGEKEQDLILEAQALEQAKLDEDEYKRYHQLKKQRWTEEVREIEKSRDENNERKKLEAKIKKLMERDIQRKMCFATNTTGGIKPQTTGKSNAKKGTKLI